MTQCDKEIKNDFKKRKKKILDKNYECWMRGSTCVSDAFGFCGQDENCQNNGTDKADSKTL